MSWDNFRVDVFRARTENYLPADWFSQNIRVLLQPTTLVVGTYRLGHWARQVRLPVVRHLVLLTAELLRRPVEWATGCFISPSADIGPGFLIRNIYGILIGATRIGRNFTIDSGAKIGDTVNSIGDDVSVCWNAVVLEAILIGHNVRVAPGSVVLSDVPDNTMVMGVPAHIERRLVPVRPSRNKETFAGVPESRPA